jgi:hyperosmotically inducible protein
MTQENTMIKKIALASAIAITAIYSTGCAVVRDQESVGAYVDDATITTRVKARFADNTTVSAMAIQVETLKGSVQLSGFAKSSAERANAEAIAKGVPGVTRVINNITVRP